MEMNAPWITCRMGKKMSLLAKDEKAYYIIEVGKHLDYATEEWLERQGVSEELLKELNLSFEYIPQKSIRGVAISGSTVRQDVILYLKSEKRKLTLQRDYDPDWLDSFFDGISRFAAPKSKAEKSKDQWDAKQDRELFHKLRFVAPLCLILGLSGSVGFILTDHWAFFTLCLILFAVQIGLLIAMPGYFTFELPKQSKRKHAWELSLPLEVMTLVLIAGVRINWLDDRAFWICTIVGVAIAFVISAKIEAFCNQKWWLLGVAVFGALGGWYIIGTANEVYDFSEPASYVLEVEDLSRSGGKRRNYYCTVTLPDGREEKLDISRSLYDSLEEGDFVWVEVADGFFGIEYANVYSVE